MDDLRSAETVRRDAAIARLRVIGARAIPRLTTVIHADADAGCAAAALNALEGMEDSRALDLALHALGSKQPAVQIAATRVLRGWVAREEGTRALEALTVLAVDENGNPAVRRSAVEALSELPPDLVRPVLDQGPVSEPAADEDPAAFRAWLSSLGRNATLSQLHQAVVHAAERERSERSAAARQHWLAARAAAHAALALRGSRVALYDLRDAFAAATSPLPLDFLNAVTAVGDASCLEPMARAWDASPGEAWWRERLSAAADEIVHRTRLSGRSAVVRRVRARWPGFL